MPLIIPTRQDVNRQGQNYIRAELPELSAVGQRRSFVSGLTRGFYSAVHDLYVAFKKYADHEPFPQTATEGFFAGGWWIDITGLSRKPAAPPKGTVVVTGTAGTAVPAGTQLTANGLTYRVENSVSIVEQTLRGTSSIVNILRGRFVTEEPHLLATGMTVSINGAIDESLNGSFEIEVIDTTTIEYPLSTAVTGLPIEPNTVLTATWANAVVVGDVTGPAGNLTSGSVLTVASAVSGLNATARVCFDGIIDGADLENLESWRDRVLDGLAVDYGTFTPDEIRIVAKTVPGVTRVFVRRPTREPTPGYPLEGQTKIAFLREDDADPIPSAAEVEQVRQVIYDRLVPAHMVRDDCIVMAPERYNLAVRLRFISPDTPGMRQSIRDHLLEFLALKATWGGSLKIDDIKCAIRAAYDAETARALDDFSLDTPTMDIELPPDAYPVLAGVEFTI